MLQEANIYVGFKDFMLGAIEGMTVMANRKGNGYSTAWRKTQDRWLLERLVMSVFMDDVYLLDYDSLSRFNNITAFIE